MRSDSLYYDEVGIGGTISHVTTEYNQALTPEMKLVKVDTFNVVLHKIIQITSSYIVPVLREHGRKIEKV